MPRGNEPASGREARAGGSRRASVAALLMIVGAVLVMIALLTYDPADESHINLHAADLPGMVTGDQTVRAMARVNSEFLQCLSPTILMVRNDRDAEDLISSNLPGHGFPQGFRILTDSGSL